jgi:hypothetical protein
MKSKKELKKIVFHSSFEDQRLYGQQYAIGMGPKERLEEMYRLNRKIFGSAYGKISEKIEIFSGEKGETVKDFYHRINRNG